MGQLEFPSPHVIRYTTKELCISVLGGIELYHLDRMRVTLKIETLYREHPEYLEQPDMAALAIRQNLDLYNDQQIEKLCRKVSERMEMASFLVMKALAALTELLETHRQTQLEEQQQAKDKPPVQLATQEQEAALAFLKTPGLIQRTDEAIAMSGVIGEQINRMILFIIFTSRKRNSPLHAISLGSSGTGKSHLQESIAALIPEEDKIEITSLTSNALYYFEQHALKNKLLLIEDLDGAEQALFPIRELQSKKKISKTISYKDSKGNTRTMQLTVEGPVCVAGCTTQEAVYEDNANRSFLLQLDESKEQDEAVMQYQRKRSAGTVNTDQEQQVRRLMQNCQRLLQPITVINPYAEHLKIPQDVFKSRRTNKHYLDFIEAVTYYHQYQRTQRIEESTGEIYIETTLEDIAAANKLMKEALLRKSDTLTGASRDYAERLRQYFATGKQATFTNRDMQQQHRIPLSTIKRYHKELLEAGILLIAGKEHQTFHYILADEGTYQALQDKVSSELDTILQQLQPKEIKKTRKAQ